MEFKYCKVEVFIPRTHLEPLKKALAEVDAGHIGSYDHCLSYTGITSCWRPLEGTHPFIGSEGQLSEEPEYRVETVCLTERVDETISAIKRVHPYEVPVINILPIYRTAL